MQGFAAAARDVEAEAIAAAFFDDEPFGVLRGFDEIENHGPVGLAFADDGIFGAAKVLEMQRTGTVRELAQVIKALLA